MDLVPHCLIDNNEASQFADAIEDAAEGIAHGALREQAARLRHAQAVKSVGQARNRIQCVRSQLLESIAAWQKTPDHEPVMKAVAWSSVLAREADMARAAQEFGVPEAEAKTGALKMRQHYCQAPSFRDGVDGAHAAVDVAVEEPGPAETPIASPPPRPAAAPASTTPARPGAAGPVVRIVGQAS